MKLNANELSLRIFLITPVRNITPEFMASVSAWLLYLERKGHEVYYPPRDTDQADRTGLSICKQNLRAMSGADVVHVCWDGQSEGCLFDLGMAFALGKEIHPVIGLFPPMSRGKSFASMVHDWEERQHDPE